MDVVKVHHLDCCTMCPRFVKVNATGKTVGHVLAIETTNSGVVLVDTGIGTAARAKPSRHLGAPFTFIMRPDRNPAGSALEQLRRLGLADDVRHIVPTHLDVDHAGGLPDFPRATVHVHQREFDAAMSKSGPFMERQRYRSVLWSHKPTFATYEHTGEPWFGFDAVHELDGLPADILAIPLPGHTRGHTAIAINTPTGWLLHGGDGFFTQGMIDPRLPAPNPVLRRFERTVGLDKAQIEANHERLGELVRAHDDQVRVFSAHDPDEFERLRGS